VRCGETTSIKGEKAHHSSKKKRVNMKDRRTREVKMEE